MATPEERQARIAAIKAENDRLHALAGTAHDGDTETYLASIVAKHEETINTWAEGASDRLKAGQPIVIYKSIYIPVDSYVNDEQLGTFDIRELQAAGLAGWEIVSTVPRTTGIGLKNTSFGSSMGTSWGAGIGGNILGVHVLLAKKVTSADQEDFEKLAKPSVAKLMADGFSI
jgi:hypothetical protein